MRWPAPLLRRNPKAHKNDFGHVLVLAGSRNMLGAAALTSLAAMRAGAGLVTVGVPQSLNTALQKKISPVVMTLSLPETRGQSLSSRALPLIEKERQRFDAVAIGPGLSRNKDTLSLVKKIVVSIERPLVIDADALFAVAPAPQILLRTNTPKVLTPHLGEMARLTGLNTSAIERDRQGIAKRFAIKYRCTLLLKGQRSIVASPAGKIYVNTTGNVGMATAGSGDVLTGIIAAFLGQGIGAFEATRHAVYVHGKAGDLAAKKIGKVSLIASDLLELLPAAFQKSLPRR